MALTETGLEAVIKNLSNFEAGAKTIQKAYDDIEKKAGGVERSTGSLSSKLSALGSPLASLGGQFAGLGDSLLKVGMVAGGAALLGVSALTAGLVAMGTVGVKKAIDLDAQMATIAATMNTTKDAVGPLKDLILDLALDPNLTVNATEAANAIQLLAQNGVTMTQIMDGAAASTVALANATGAEFTTAATVASGVMQVFGIDAKNMGTAIDGITGVVNASKFTIDDYGQAFAQAGGIAASMGITFEDFNTVITASANNFSSGSDAGTSFKTMLQRLANPTDEAKAKMEKYGISLFDAEGKMRPLSEVAQQLNNVFQGTVSVTEILGGATEKEAKAAENASEKISGLTSKISTNEKQLQLYNDQLALEIGYYGQGSPKVRQRELQIERLTNTINTQKQQLGEYQGAIAKVDGAQAQQITTLKTLTEAEKAELAAVIGGADAARSVLALSQLTSDQFNTLSGSVNDAGQAFRAAATRVDSVQGAFDIFQGIIEALQIQIGDKFLPLIRQVTVWFSDLAVKFGPKVVAFFGSVATGIGSLINKAPGLLNLFGKGGLAGLFASAGFTGSALFFKKLSKLFRLITGDAGTLGETITNVLGSAFTWLTTNLFPILSQGIQFIIDHFEEFKGAMLGVGAVLGGAVFAALLAGLFSLLTPINLIIAGAALLGAAWAGNWGGIQEKTFAAWAVIQPLLAQLAQWLQVNIPIAIQFLSDAWNNVLWPAISMVADFITQTVIPLFSDFIANYIDVTSARATVLADTWTNYLLPALTAVGDFIQSSVIPVFMQVWNWLQINLPVAIQTVVNFWNTYFLPAITAVSNFITTILIPAFLSMWTWLSTNIAAAIQTVSNIWNTVFMPAITAVWAFIQDPLMPLFSAIAELLNAVVGKAVEALAGLWQNVLHPALTLVWNYISENIITIFNEVAAIINVTLGVALQKLSDLWEDTLWPAIKKVSDLLSAVLQPAMTVIADLLEKRVTKAIQKGEKIMTPFAKGIERVIKAVKDLTGYFKALADVVGNFSLPPVLTPGSPTPFETALTGIASAANQAGIAIQAMGTGFNIAPTAIDALLGIQRGVAGVHEIIGSARDDLEDWFEQFPVERSKIKLALSQINSLFHQNADEILGATDRVAAFQAVLKRATERGGMSFEFLGFDPFGGKGGGALSVFLQAFDKQKEKLEKLQLQIFQMAGRTALTIGNKLNDVIQGSADILNDRVKSLQELVESGLNEVNFEGQIISATRAQELFNEALAEQRSIQDDLLELRRNEQRLGFLEKQLNLIETIQGAGLDPAEILGGLRLGMDASIPDLIEATNRLVTAMIDQVNTDLQIGSPSKVLFKQGEFAGQGLIGGFLDQMPNLAGVIQRAISAPAMVSAPALSAAGGGSVTHVYQMGGNTISNGMNEAQFAARVMQVIRGALR